MKDPMTLTDFLLARIAEDEKGAETAAFGVPWESDQCAVTETTATAHGEVIADDCWSRPIADRSDHIARHDPARVLAECEAKRRIVDLAEAVQDDMERLAPGFASVVVLDKFARILALPYADHPDYREEWKP